MNTFDTSFPFVPRRTVPARSLPLARQPNSTYEDSEASDLSSDDQSSAPLTPLLKHKKPQLRSILKRSHSANNGSKGVTRLAISVASYHSACCGVVVRVERMSDTRTELNERFRGHCPSCSSACQLELKPAIAAIVPEGSSMITQLSAKITEASSSERPSKSHGRKVQFAKFPTILSPQPAPGMSTEEFPLTTVTSHASSSCTISPQRVAFDAIYSFFNQDFTEVYGEVYPDSEHTDVLSSSVVSTDLYETFVRVMSVGGLTVLLYAVLT